ncbi:MAG: TIGR04283 family arsenosugar biosynthesis glycosyltransferase [bacterium]|nr:TIGR04283 family arsenosugar biosynthesis glycosyltransferase [bacterium]
MINNKFYFSIIIPVFQEADKINGLIENILNQFSDDKFEIIVVDAESSLNTINAINIEFDNIKKITSVKNRAKQMNAGAYVSEGEVLVFLHADCVLPGDALIQIKKSLKSDTKIVAGAFDIKIDSDNIIFKIISIISSLRSRYTKIPYGDQAIFVQKEYFFKLGKYREIPIMEDVDLMLRIKKNNGRIHIFSASVTASPRRWENEGILYYTLKNWIITTLYFIGISPDKLKIFYGNL